MKHLTLAALGLALLLASCAPAAQEYTATLLAMDTVMELTAYGPEGEGALEEAQALMDQADVLVDCVFGFSFRGEISGVPARLLGYGGGLSCLKISADLPSGVECDTGRVCAGAAWTSANGDAPTRAVSFPPAKPSFACCLRITRFVTISARARSPICN